MQDEMYGEEQFADMPWYDIVTAVQGEKRMLNKPEFDKESWGVRIQYAQKVLDIFEKSGNKDNNILLQEFTTTIDQFIMDLSEKERVSFLKSQELTVKISELDEKLKQLYDTMYPKESFLNDNNEEEEDIIDNDSDDTNYELQDTMEDLREKTHTELHNIFSENWKIQFIIHLQKRSKLLFLKAESVEDFKANGMDEDHPMPESLRTIMNTTRHKILYSNFGIHFLVADKDWGVNSYLGRYYTNTPFTINKTGEDTRRTLEHEGRHNIFNALVSKELPPLETFIKKIDERIKIVDRFKSLRAPDVIIGNRKMDVANLVTDMANNHINENKDEILANFEYLAKGIPSTDIHKYHKGKELLQKLRKKYEEKGLSTDILDICIEIFSREMQVFYREMADYFFIAEHIGSLQEMRLIVYWIDLEEHDIIKSYLKSKIQNGPYMALSAMRRIIDPLGIEGLLSGKKRKAVLSQEELLLREIFFNASKPRNDNGFERALQPSKIRALRYYFEKYKEFDPEKRFQNNQYLKEFLTLILPKKISEVSQDIKKMEREDPKIIEIQKYMKNLLAISRKGRLYLYGE